MEDTQIIQALADIGTSAILLYFIMKLWEDKKDRDIKQGDQLRLKDENISDLNKGILEVVRENTKVQSELTQAVQANTKSNETLTSKIYDVLTKNGHRTDNNNN